MFETQFVNQYVTLLLSGLLAIKTFDLNEMMNLSIVLYLDDFAIEMLGFKTSYMLSGYIIGCYGGEHNPVFIRLYGRGGLNHSQVYGGWSLDDFDRYELCCLCVAILG